MRRINSPDANMKTVSLSEWDLLTLRSNGELKLALRFFDGEVQIVIYRPGPWERWFGTYDIADREIIEPEKAVA